MSALLTMFNMMVSSSAASSGPTIIHTSASANRSASTATFLLLDNSGNPITATAGHRLLAGVMTDGGGASHVVTPSGWSLAGSYVYSSTYVGYLFTKISDGTENGITVSCSSGAAYTAGGIVECTGNVGTYDGGFFALPHNATSNTFGPSTTPIGAASLPILFALSTTATQPATPSSPWVLDPYGAVANVVQGAVLYQDTGPDAAVSCTYNTSAANVSYGNLWMMVWLDP